MIIYGSDKLFKDKLSELAIKSSWYSSLYTESSLKYYQQRPKDEGKKLQDKSFILEWEREPVAAFIGGIVEFGGINSLVAYEVPCIMVECKEGITGKAIKVFIHEFYKILSEINGEVRIRDYLIGGEISPLSSYIMLKGANALPNFIRVIDLTKDAVQLKSQVRKSYGSLINWGLRELEPQIIDKNKIKWGHFLQFRELHIRESGRETRSIKTWRRQYDSVLNGEGFLVFGHLENKLISAGYFSVSQTNCCYGVSASRRDLFHKPLFHSLMWKSMLYAKEIGCRWFEVGEQHFLNHPTGHHVTKKEQGISDFKAGFGGKTRLFLDLNLSIKESIL